MSAAPSAVLGRGEEETQSWPPGSSCQGEKREAGAAGGIHTPGAGDESGHGLRELK